MSISNNALIFYHAYTIKSKKKSVYFTDFSIKTSFSLEYRDRFERLLGSEIHASHPIPVRQAGVLLSASFIKVVASLDLHDSLVLPLFGRTADFHRIDTRALLGAQTKELPPAGQTGVRGGQEDAVREDGAFSHRLESDYFLALSAAAACIA